MYRRIKSRSNKKSRNVYSTIQIIFKKLHCGVMAEIQAVNVAAEVLGATDH